MNRIGKLEFTQVKKTNLQKVAWNLRITIA